MIKEMQTFCFTSRDKDLVHQLKEPSLVPSSSHGGILALGLQYRKLASLKSTPSEWSWGREKVARDL
jgi:hypothetical protein